MDPQGWRRICEVFEAARLVHGEARAALLEAAPDVAAEVRELLEHHESAAGGFDTPGDTSQGGTVVETVVGTAVGPYRIESVLGEGGMGTVYLAAGPDGPVALKRLHARLRAEPAIGERFRREAALGSRIRHPNVVRTIGLLGDDCLVMEFVQGRTLEALLDEEGALPESSCRHLGLEIARALVAIHAAGAVHRDLKPANVMLAEDGSIKVMDLGIALPLDDLLRLSRTGQFVGTVRYSAPEQLTGDKLRADGRTDLYALGLLLYELAAGRHPLPEGGLVTTMRAHLETMPERLAEANDEVTPFFDAVVHVLLAKTPDERFASADELVGILEAGEEGAWWQARSSSG